VQKLSEGSERFFAYRIFAELSGKRLSEKGVQKLSEGSERFFAYWIFAELSEKRLSGKEDRQKNKECKN